MQLTLSRPRRATGAARGPPRPEEPQHPDRRLPPLREPRHRHLLRPRRPAPVEHRRLPHQLQRTAAASSPGGGTSGTSTSARCDIESNQSPDGPPTANFLIDCSGSTHGTGEVAIIGCTLQHNNPSPDSANIRIIGRSNPGRDGEVVREGNVAITGNVLSDVKVNVHLKDCRGVVLEGQHVLARLYAQPAGRGLHEHRPGPEQLRPQPAVQLRQHPGGEQPPGPPQLRGLHDRRASTSPTSGAARRACCIDGCRRINLSNCTILDCDGVGLLLRDVSAEPRLGLPDPRRPARPRILGPAPARRRRGEPRLRQPRAREDRRRSPLRPARRQCRGGLSGGWSVMGGGWSERRGMEFTLHPITLHPPPTFSRTTHRWDRTSERRR